MVDQEITIVIPTYTNTEGLKKLIEWFNNLNYQGVIAVFVIHAFAEVETFWTRAIYLNHLQIIIDSTSEIMRRKYLQGKLK